MLSVILVNIFFKKLTSIIAIMTTKAIIPQFFQLVRLGLLASAWNFFSTTSGLVNSSLLGWDRLLTVPIIWLKRPSILLLLFAISFLLASIVANILAFSV